MHAMERLRRRLEGYLNDRSTSAPLRQKALADYMGKSEVWLSNILSGKRGLRLVDLDKVADFFHVPPAELIRQADDPLLEVTPTEMALLRRLRRLDDKNRDALLTLARVAVPELRVSAYSKNRRLK